MNVLAKMMEDGQTDRGGRWKKECSKLEMPSILSAHNVTKKRKRKKFQTLKCWISPRLSGDSLNCTRKSGNVGQACKICACFAAVFVFAVVVNVVEEEKEEEDDDEEEEMGTILPILYECLICIEFLFKHFCSYSCGYCRGSCIYIERSLLSFSCAAHTTRNKKEMGISQSCVTSAGLTTSTDSHTPSCFPLSCSAETDGPTFTSPSDPTRCFLDVDQGAECSSVHHLLAHMCLVLGNI